jgi:CHAD domain-containing protein
MEKMDVAIQADEPLRAGLLRVADNLVRNAVERIKNASNDRVEDLHIVRVTIKRLRAILRMIRPAIKKRAFDRENGRLRTAARRLSSARDADVARKTLATLPFAKQSEKDAGAVALAGFRKNGTLEADISKTMKVTALNLEKTRRNLHQLQISRDEWKLIQTGVRKVYRQCRKRMKRAVGHGDDDAYHKWRIRIKSLYYELQMLQSVWPARLTKMVAGLNKLQDQIGADHDLIVLKRSLDRNPDRFGGSQGVERVLRSVNDKRRKLKRTADPLGKAILDQTPRSFVRELGQHYNNWRGLSISLLSSVKKSSPIIAQARDPRHAASDPQYRGNRLCVRPDPGIVVEPGALGTVCRDFLLRPQTAAVQPSLASHLRRIAPFS